ncbi:MAG TPA: multicopper oxidase domain-containing protein [Gemmatimonadales bacterium]|nr:multicopper oxidase domain-containing protein [Gemmatimonadales bacterium]
MRGAAARAGRGASVAALLLAGGAVAGTTTHRRSTPPIVQANPNVARAGALHDGVLTVSLEAEPSSWPVDGPNSPPMTVAAFAEPGQAPLAPGPLLRAPAGTELRLSVRNSLAAPLVFFVPKAIHGGPDRMAATDSVLVAPGAVGQLTTQATVPGNYVYRAVVRGDTGGKGPLTGLLAGALVVDTVGAAGASDRIFVIMATRDSARAAHADTAGRAPNPFAIAPENVYTINGRSWPGTERVTATVGDSLHWRVINASTLPHPMHLHGFYYRVDAFSAPSAEGLEPPAPGRMVVTQYLPAFAAMSIMWSPARPGTWLFHCHLAIHNMPGPLSASPDDPNLRAMTGLIVAVDVAGRPGVPAPAAPAPRRRLRLVAVTDPEVAGTGPDGVSAMRFVLEEHGRRADTGRDASAEIDLTRGEPVSITIVNQLREPTSVHWHGIEVEESYMDGVPDVSGAGTRLTPAIAPGDSFEARFTPPRSGTFMYHAHIDEPREEIGGLEGPLIVRDPGAPPSADDHVFFYKGYSLSRAHPAEINGEGNPDTVVLHAGRPARLRLLNLATTSFDPVFSLTARADTAPPIADDTMIVRWRPLAKDGFDFPLAEAARPARQLVSIGETYDFEYTPAARGTLRLEVRAGRPARLLIRVPIRVE